MPPSALTPPRTDPSPIFETFRGAFGTELLTVAVAHFSLCGTLAEAGPMEFEPLRARLGLAPRPARVLLTALRAMGLLAEDGGGRIGLTELAREHLVPGGAFDVGDYVGL